jgi:3-deoxy-D-manno-octulosonic-acid transferase
VLALVDLALMQGEKDADRVTALGAGRGKVEITGNIKFDLAMDEAESQLTSEFRDRFGIDGNRPLIVAASTHEPEEKWVLEALETSGYPFRVLFAPRHPERFENVARMLEESRFAFSRRSHYAAESDRSADVILLDSIGELRAVFPLADIVFVGGSLILHGGQSVLEPASAGKAIVVGPYTHNFEEVIKGFLAEDAIIQADPRSSGHDETWELYRAIRTFLDEPEKRAEYGDRALGVMRRNRGATNRTIEALKPLLTRKT